MEISRTVLLSDIVARLPDSPAGPSAERGEGRIVLTDASREILYQWGPHQPAAGQSPAAAVDLAAPLSGWRLAFYAPDLPGSGSFARGAAFPVAAGLAAALLALAGLAVYFYRENTRDLREAAQRVTFVNQVSHELKTPLTNIRLYAELLEDEIPAEARKARTRLAVITAETERLSRLIHNVLTFAREQKKTLQLRIAPAVVDEVVAAVVQSFRPALEAREIAIETDLRAPAPVSVDRDALEQILGNLFGNVEKYAASGKSMKVSSRQEGDCTEISVADKGPGIAPGDRARVFEPFVRLSHRLTDGTTGAGIGLTIARALARRHGGDVRLESEGEGACFKVTLRTPPADEG